MGGGIMILYSDLTVMNKGEFVMSHHQPWLEGKKMVFSYLMLWFISSLRHCEVQKHGACNLNL